MIFINDLKSDTITDTFKGLVENTTDLTTDDSASYTKINEQVHSHTSSVIPKEQIAQVLPWVHTASAMPNGNYWVSITK